MDHPEGRNKARVFKAVLGIERKYANAFAEIIRVSLPRASARRGTKDTYGERWVTYHEIIGLNGQPAIVTVAWIFKTEQPDSPTLVSSYVELEEQEKLAELLSLG